MWTNATGTGDSHVAPTWTKWPPRILMWKYLAFYAQPQSREALQGNIHSTKKLRSTLDYYKNPKTLTNQGTHNNTLALALWSDRKFSFLT